MRDRTPRENREWLPFYGKLPISTANKLQDLRAVDVDMRTVDPVRNIRSGIKVVIGLIEEKHALLFKKERNG